jgi:hypothetical protein
LKALGNRAAIQEEAMNGVMRKRQLIEMQGYIGVPEGEVPFVDRWSRLSPALCLLWLAAALAWWSPWLVFALSGIALAGALLPRHPFDLVYDIVIRRITRGPALPGHGIPRRFGCAVATLLLLVVGSAMLAGAERVAIGVASVMVILPSVVIVTGFCVPSFAYHRLVAPHFASSRASSPPNGSAGVAG